MRQQGHLVSILMYVQSSSILMTTYVHRCIDLKTSLPMGHVGVACCASRNGVWRYTQWCGLQMHVLVLSAKHHMDNLSTGSSAWSVHV